MSKAEGKHKLYAIMYGFFAIGAVALVLGGGFKTRMYGLGFIVIGLIIALILQFVLGEDVIRFRKPKIMK